MVMATFGKAERDRSCTPKRSQIFPTSLASSPYLERMKLVDPPSPRHGGRSKSRARAKSPFSASMGNRYEEYSVSGRRKSDGHKRETGLLLLPFEIDDLARNADGNQTFDQQQQHKKISEWEARNLRENDDDTYSDESSVGPEFATCLDDEAVLQWPKRHSRKPRKRRQRKVEHSATVKREEPEDPVFKLPPVNPTKSLELEGGNDGTNAAMAKNKDSEDNYVQLSRQRSMRSQKSTRSRESRSAGSTKSLVPRSRESRSAGSTKSLVPSNEVEQWTTVKMEEPEVPPLKLPPLNATESLEGGNEGNIAVAVTNDEESGSNYTQLSQRSTSSLGSKSAGSTKGHVTLYE